MANKKKSPATASPAAKPLPVASLGELEAIHSRPIRVVTVIVKDGVKQPVEIVGRRLTPRETEPVRCLLDEAQPKVIPGEKPGDPPRFDLEEKDYPGGFRARSERLRRKARALALWAAYPMFREAVPAGVAPPQDQEEIFTFVENRHLPDDLMESLYAELRNDEVKSLRDCVGFI